jgi:FlaA1/EpsC-like NDP-sugar epimerase
MTIPEAAQLVIQAGAMAEGGDVFVLDMGDPVRIVDLARSMIELSGLSVRDDHSGDGDIAIEQIGLRPGEKLYEELLIGNNPSISAHPRILRANEPFIAWNELRSELDRLRAMIDHGASPAARNLLQKLVVEFEPMTEVVDFVTLRQEEVTVDD